MPKREQVYVVLREWMEKADHDLKTASHTLTLGEQCPTDTVCFHAQQCVEKYLKAMLVLEGIDFPKTHNLKSLMGLLPDRACPSLSAEEQQRLLTKDEQALLTPYAVVTRYPGWREIPLAEARRAVTLARRVRKEVRRLLPKKALRPKGRL